MRILDTLMFLSDFWATMNLEEKSSTENAELERFLRFLATGFFRFYNSVRF